MVVIIFFHSHAVREFLIIETNIDRLICDWIGEEDV